MPRGINEFDEDRLDGLNFGDANSSNIVSPGIVTDGLVMHLDAGNYQSYPIAGTSWYDLSDRRNNGTLTDGPTYVRDGGGAISFDGTNDYVTFSSAPAIAGAAATWCAWWYGIEQLANSVIWFDNNTATVTRQFTVALPNSGNIIFDAGNGTNGSTYDRIIKGVTVSEYTGWNYWAFIKDSGAQTMSIYRNASLWHSGTGKTLPIGTINGAAFLAVGKTGGAGSLLYANGHFAFVKLYNRALTPTEVAQNFNATRARFNI